MILTEVYKTIEEIPNRDDFHIETAMVKSDDLLKRILRVKTDHGNSYGIRLSDDSSSLENGAAFILSEGDLLVLQVIPDEMLLLRPKTIDEMGELAHMLGNLHKPVQVKDGCLSLLYDKVVADTLTAKGINYQIQEMALDEPLRYADLSNG